MIIALPNIITIVAVLGVLSILGAIALFISSVLKRENEFQEKERATFAQYQEIIKRAHKEAADLLEKTTLTSQQLLQNVKTTNETISTDFDKVMQEIATKQIQALNSEAEVLKKGYQDKLLQMQSSIDHNTEHILQDTQGRLDKQLDTFTQSLLTHATKSEQVINEKTKELLSQVEVDVAAYKKAKLAKIDASVMELIQKTYQDILGKTIPPDIHQEMIIEALEKTKKEGMFDL